MGDAFKIIQKVNPVYRAVGLDGKKRRLREGPEPLEPASIDREGAAAAEREREATRRRRREGGRASTILTSPLGVPGRANTAAKMLTGG